MAYIVNKSDNVIVATVGDGSIDTTSTSISLLGKGFNNYGEIVAENNIRMLENFSSSFEPQKPLRGQLWFDTSAKELKINVSDIPATSKFISATKAIIGTEPSLGDFEAGALWFDDGILNVAGDDISFTPLKTIKSGLGLPAPASGESGDLFFDTAVDELRVLNPNSKGGGMAEWDLVSVKYAPASDPALASLLDGDLWFDSGTKQLKIAGTTPSNFSIVGPIMPKSISTTKTEFVGTVWNDGADHVVMEQFIGDTKIAVYSDESMTGQGTDAAFPDDIPQGITLNNNASFKGDIEAPNSVSVNGVTWTSGVGMPEGSETAPTGSIYTNTTGGSGNTFWVKESGTGTTGWVAK